MKFDHLNNPDNGEIISQFVAHVTKTEEDLAEEARKSKSSTNELKIFIAKNRGFEPLELESIVDNILQDGETNQNPREFFESHHFEIEQLNSEAYHLTIRTPQYERDDDFLLLESNGYLKAITIIRKKWAEKTIEKLIQYLDSLERLFVTSDDLEEVVEQSSKRVLTGFTAKYKPFYKREKVSVQVHGGTSEHLEDVESNFNARPKRIVFSQGSTADDNSGITGDGGSVPVEESPSDAVKAAVRQDGYASVPQVRAGSEEIGIETIENVIATYEKTNEEKFEVNHRPERIKPGERNFIKQLNLEEAGVWEETDQTDGGLPEEIRTLDQGSVIEGVTIWHFEEQMPGDHYPTDREVADSLVSEIFDYKDRYSYSEIDDCNFLIYDRRCGEAFEIIISNQQMRVYAKSNTTSASFRAFYQILDEDFNSTYEFDKYGKELRA